MNLDPTTRFGFESQLFATSELNTAASTAIEGLPDEQRTSPIRRTFLLFLLLELVLNFAFWLVYIRSLGDFSKAMADQVCNMKFNTSLFDVQIITFSRFCFLEAAYGAFITTRRWPSASCTAITTIYMLAKCTVFASSQRGDPFAYTELILPIAMTWIGTLILECRVLPQEKKAKQIVDTYQRLNPNSLSVMDAHSAHVASVQRWATVAATSLEVPSIYGSPEGSFIMDPEALLNSPDCYTLGENDATVDVSALLTRAADLRQMTWSVFSDNVWNKLELSTTSLAEPQITSASIQGFGRQRVFRMDAVLYALSKTMFYDLVYGFEFSPNWNSAVSSARYLQKFTHEDLDIVHVVLKEILLGVIKSRDFVTMRAWGTKDGIYYVTSSSVTHPKCPPSNDCVRADQLINSLFLRPMGSRCHLTIITCIDLKTYFPSHVIWKGAKASMTTLYHDLQKRVITLETGGENCGEALGHPRPVLEEAC